LPSTNRQCPLLHPTPEPILISEGVFDPGSTDSGNLLADSGGTAILPGSAGNASSASNSLAARKAYQRSQLNTVYAVGNGIMVTASFPLGISFDRLGAKATSVLGGAIAITGLVGMAAAVTYPALNWLLFIAYPCANLGGGLNTYGVYGFLWIYPEHQNLLGAYCWPLTVCPQLSALNCLP
jgi:MFS family permease